MLAHFAERNANHAPEGSSGCIGGGGGGEHGDDGLRGDGGSGGSSGDGSGGSSGDGSGGSSGDGSGGSSGEGGFCRAVKRCGGGSARRAATPGAALGAEGACLGSAGCSGCGGSATCSSGDACGDVARAKVDASPSPRTITQRHSVVPATSSASAKALRNSARWRVAPSVATGN